MTKKDYIKFAKMIKELKSKDNSKVICSYYELLNNLEYKLIEIFQADNLLFDRDKFLTACQVKES